MYIIGKKLRCISLVMYLNISVSECLNKMTDPQIRKELLITVSKWWRTCTDFQLQQLVQSILLELRDSEDTLLKNFAIMELRKNVRVEKNDENFSKRNPSKEMIRVINQRLELILNSRDDAILQHKFLENFLRQGTSS